MINIVVDWLLRGLLNIAVHEGKAYLVVHPTNRKWVGSPVHPSYKWTLPLLSFTTRLFSSFFQGYNPPITFTTRLITITKVIAMRTRVTCYNYPILTRLTCYNPLTITTIRRGPIWPVLVDQPGGGSQRAAATLQPHHLPPWELGGSLRWSWRRRRAFRRAVEKSTEDRSW